MSKTPWLDGGQFARIDKSALRLDLSGSTLRTYLYLSAECDERTGVFTGSQASIATYLGVTERSVYRAAEHLERAGLLRRGDGFFILVNREEQ